MPPRVGTLMAGQYCLTTMQGAMILSRFVQPIPGHAIAGLLTTGNYRPPFMSALRFGLRRAMLATTAGAFYQYAMAWRERNQRQMRAALSGLRSVRGRMPTGEIRLTPAGVAARLDEVRRWVGVARGGGPGAEPWRRWAGDRRHRRRPVLRRVPRLARPRRHP